MIKMIELILPFLVAGIAILIVFGIKPALDKRVNNEDVCKKHYDNK